MNRMMSSRVDSLEVSDGVRGVASVPGASFFHRSGKTAGSFVRFAFCKRLDTLAAASAQLKQLL
jgi:aspartate/methionine/tyrosine aminotransferase